MKKPPKEIYEEWVEDIMQEFDFKKVHKVIKLLKWKWAGVGVPDMKEIKKTARYVMSRAYEVESGTVATAGFEAQVTKHGIGLKFVITDWDTYK